MLDKLVIQWYYNLARVGELCVHCDDAGDCGLAGNFRGVCPVIGRLNCPWTRLRISLRLKGKGSA